MQVSKASAAGLPLTAGALVVAAAAALGQHLVLLAANIAATARVRFSSDAAEQVGATIHALRCSRAAACWSVGTGVLVARSAVPCRVLFGSGRKGVPGGALWIGSSSTVTTSASTRSLPDQQNPEAVTPEARRACPHHVRYPQVAIRKAVVLASAQKTLPVAVAVLGQLSGVLGAATGFAVIPCVIAHLVQTVFDSALVARWNAREAAGLPAIG